MQKSFRTFTGTLIATPLPALDTLPGIAPSSIRHEITIKIQTHKQENDQRHPLTACSLTTQWLKSHKSFATTGVQKWSKRFHTSTSKRFSKQQNNRVLDTQSIYIQNIKST